MNYLGRPVFEFAIDWSAAVNKPFSFDLREVALGFGAPAFTSLQAHVVQGFTATVQLATDNDIAAFDDFTAALHGRLVGFWFPAPFEAMRVANVVSTTQFDIPDQKLANTWGDHPSVYLFFLKAGQVSVPAKITNVVSLGNGFERVTLDAPVAFLDVATIVRRLHYVRLVDDVERATFQAEGWQQRDVRVVELPLEYAAAETGEKKIFLYHFWFVAPIDAHWYFTSFAADVVSNNLVHQSPRPANVNKGIAHRDRRTGIQADDSLDIEAVWDAGHPFATFFPIPLPAYLHVQISETTFGDPDTTTPIFTGRVVSVRDAGDKLIAKCDTFGAILKRKAPRAVVQPECNNHLFDFGCKAPTWLWMTTATVVSSDPAAYPPTLVVTLNTPAAAMQVANYFAQGWLETGVGTQFEIRTILASSYNGGAGQLTLTLNLGLQHAVAGQTLQLAPGCNGDAATCKSKFNNFVNFGGFVAVPEKNLSLQALENETNVGDKK